MRRKSDGDDELGSGVMVVGGGLGVDRAVRMGGGAGCAMVVVVVVVVVGAFESDDGSDMLAFDESRGRRNTAVGNEPL